MRTPPPPSDITALFPALRGHERTTTMLHPVPGAPGVRDSSIGGPLLWPADEPWPRRPYGSRADRAPQAEPLPLIAVAQLWVRDLPDLPHPPGKDLLQVLWIPDDTVDCLYGSPQGDPADESFEVRWRASAEIADPAPNPPRPGSGDGILLEEGYLPVPCTLSPERVAEYPPAWVLGEAFHDHVAEQDERMGTWYPDVRSYADGCKVGGWPADSNIGGPYHGWFTCDCGTPLEALLTIASMEVRHTPETAPSSYRVPAGEPRGPALSEPTGLTVGDNTYLQVYYCPASWDHPIRRYPM
ncbi:DUF1963 domain-containing protein [Actinomadura sp. 21ATH]|uniref:DUF1963 domain-containing protein n=1 Tax=Actinomadura sp. 21ATH TaxID=1735444 RepID=UPI0035C13CC5